MDALKEYREKVKSGELAKPGKPKNPKQRFNSNATRKNAIHYFCMQCMGEVEGYMSEIRNCTDLKCDLRDFRPYK